MKLSSLGVGKLPESVAIPSGEYAAKVLTAEVRDSKTGTGSYILVRFSILDQKFAGRFVSEFITLKSPSEYAQEAGRLGLRKLLEAAGLDPEADPDLVDVQGKRMMATVVVRPAKGDFPESNLVIATRVHPDGPIVDEGLATSDAAEDGTEEATDIDIPF
jgi:hypothetical protein